MDVIQEIISILPSLLWFFLVVIVLLSFRNTIRDIVSALTWRVKSGAELKIASFELGSTYVSPDRSIVTDTKLINMRADEDGKRYRERGQYYLPNRDIFLVHRIAPSSKQGQLYDILIYLIPHKDATLACVQKVEYYFGPHWGDRIFTSTNRARGFAISTSAYGPFVCTAEIYFTDGQKTIIWRYIDFEMGQIGKGM